MTAAPPWKFIAIGAMAGIINGLFGAGGGLLLVPLFLSWCHMKDKTAFATSLSVMLALSAVSLAVYGIRRGIDLPTAMPYVVGGLVGGLLAGLWMKRVQVKWLRLALAAFLLYGGLKAVVGW